MFVFYKANQPNPDFMQLVQRSIATGLSVFATLILAAFLFGTSAHAQNYDSRAPQAILLDADTGTVLYAKEEGTKIPPASLAKLMTM